MLWWEMHNNYDMIGYGTETPINTCSMYKPLKDHPQATL